MHLLYGMKILIKTDHRPLTFITAGSDANRKLARWWSVMNEFDYEIEYVTGKSNLVADALSRLTTSGYMLDGEDLQIGV